MTRWRNAAWGIALSLSLAGPALGAGKPPDSISLAGTWIFRADPGDAGLGGRWFDRPMAAPGANLCRLPGSMAENGLGDAIAVDTPWTGQIVDRSWFTEPRYAPYRQPGRIKVPFWLNPDKHYVGPAWYEREIEIPREWKGRRIVLRLERCHWETRLWVDGREAGRRDSLSVPHDYDLTSRAGPGRRRLTLRVDNRIREVDVGSNAHSVSDHTQTNWNGVVGRMEIAAGPTVWIDEVRVYPDPGTRSARIVVVIGNASGRTQTGRLLLAARGVKTSAVFEAAPVSVPFSAPEGRSEVEAGYALGPRAPLWDEFSPNVLDLSVTLRGRAEGLEDARTVSFGLRDVKVQGTRFIINGRPVFLRGTLECAIFPRTGYPEMTIAAWRRIFGVVKAHGLNHVRFHSWCPPGAAFDAADEAGIYLYVENPAWTEVGEGRAFDRWLYEESERIVREYGNHPSFCMMSYGNEPGGKNQARFLGEFVKTWRAKDGRRLYTGGAGWPQIPENEFHVSAEPRIQRWGEGLNSVINKQPPQTLFDFRDILAKFERPVVGHEIGQWCVYPNLKEISKYTGVLKAKNFEIFRDSLEAAGMGGLAADFLYASGKLQALCYKADIEAALRTPGFAGFELLDLHDFPGQGTALVGVLDAFWEEKGYIRPEEFRRFCAPTVPLARLAKMVFTSDENFAADIEAAHFGPAPLRGISPEWRISEAKGGIVREGRLAAADIPWGNAVALGAVKIPLAGWAAPARYRFMVRVGEAENDWDFWVYPASRPPETAAGVRIVRRLDREAEAFLARGGRLILMPEKGAVRPEAGGDVALGFSSIFWNTAWTSRQPPHTLGLLIDPGHPALAAFPSERYSQWQWWDAVTHGQAVRLDALVPGLSPIVRIIDDWVTNRPLGLIFEIRSGGGKVLVCAADLLTDAERRPEARQLLRSLTAYAAGPAFDPRTVAELNVLRGLFRE